METEIEELTSFTIDVAMGADNIRPLMPVLPPSLPAKIDEIVFRKAEEGSSSNRCGHLNIVVDYMYLSQFCIHHRFVYSNETNSDCKIMIAKLTFVNLTVSFDITSETLHRLFNSLSTTTIEFLNCHVLAEVITNLISPCRKTLRRLIFNRCALDSRKKRLIAESMLHDKNIQYLRIHELTDYATKPMLFNPIAYTNNKNNSNNKGAGNMFQGIILSERNSLEHKLDRKSDTEIETCCNRNRALELACLSSLSLLLIRQHKRSILSGLDKNIVLTLAKSIYDTRYAAEWHIAARSINTHIL